MIRDQYIVGYDIYMMSQLAAQAQVNSPQLAFSDGYVVKFYLKGQTHMTGTDVPFDQTEYVRLPPYWEYV